MPYTDDYIYSYIQIYTVIYIDKSSDLPSSHLTMGDSHLSKRVINSPSPDQTSPVLSVLEKMLSRFLSK